MAGKGKIGKFSVKGFKKSSDSAKQKDVPNEITVGAIRRMARRGGIKRISAGSYSEVRSFADDFLFKLVRDIVVFTENAHRATISVNDVVLGLKHNGRVIYGYGY